MGKGRSRPQVQELWPEQRPEPRTTILKQTLSLTPIIDWRGAFAVSLFPYNPAHGCLWLAGSESPHCRLPEGLMQPSLESPNQVFVLCVGQFLSNLPNHAQ
jgi:hypothetical protein